MSAATMRVIEISEPGGPEVLTPAKRALPEPDAGEILIRVAYAGVNRPDTMQRAGQYAPPDGASDLPGLEASGEVAAIGQDVTRWQVGDQVCALLPGGGYAEYVATPADHALPVPQGFSMMQAAGLPETHFTVWTNMIDRGRLAGGETVLVHGGASGIGTTAIQMASALGARVFATAGADDRCRFCERLGAERGINHRNEDFVDVVRAAGGADVILDMVSGTYVPRDLAALNEDGRLVLIAALGGTSAEVNFAKLMVKRQTITGSTLRPQGIAAKARIAQALERDVWPFLSDGRIGPVIDGEFALENAAAAHARMEDGGVTGKILLRVGG